MVANVWPLKIWIPAVSVVVVGLLARLLGGSPLLWSVLAGAVVLALLCGGLGIAAAQTPDAQSLAAASGGEPPAAPAVVDPQPAGGVFLSLCCWRSCWCCAAICLTAGSSSCPAEPELLSDQYRPEQIVPVKTFLAEHQTRAAEFIRSSGPV